MILLYPVLTQAQQPNMQDCCLLCIDDLPPAKVAEKHKKL
jgi:hypothetical protein